MQLSVKLLIESQLSGKDGSYIRWCGICDRYKKSKLESDFVQFDMEQDFSSDDNDDNNDDDDDDVELQL